MLKKHRAEKPGADLCVAIIAADVAHAGEFPLLMRPDQKAMFPRRKPEEFLRGPILHSGEMRNFPVDRGLRPGENLDPLTQALHAAGAVATVEDAFRT